MTFINKDDAENQENTINAGNSETEIGAEAQEATTLERELDIRIALKLYPKAAAWSFFFSLGVIMTGYGPQIIGNLYGVPRFQQDFGYLFNGKWIISAAWQSGLSMGSPIGQVVGALAATYPMEIFGRKKTFSICVVLTAGCVFIQFFARSLKVLVVGELLGGLILGTYAVIAPAYASEVCPVVLRGILTAYVNLCFVIGQFIANGVSAATHGLDNHWAYSAPFATQWFWPTVILAGISFAPESPWWLVRRGRLQDAENSLRRLAASSVDVKPTLSMIIETDRLEQQMEAGTTFRDCFKKSNLRRTHIAIGVYSIQILSGVYLIGFSNYFFTLIGLSTDDAYNMGISLLGVGFLGCILSWILLAYFGRRAIYSSGLLGLATILFIIGILDCVPNYMQRPSIAWVQTSMMLVWNLIYNLSVGPVCFVILCECSATKLRGKTIAISTAIQAILGIVITVMIPYMINPDAGNMRGKIGFIFGGLASMSFVWTYFYVPETKGRTYEELDIMFERKVPTREFTDYSIL
ncbi:maltose permease [Histoplasma capsulatum G186AR]|uniref:Maltose permease n=2 Tax=Ajellomyces capsulatus TaxID=5037 RepID=C0NM84_AJECG|nr:maltose permease [Histoplasma capsulatum G186AR]EEH07735.1 maltose permease [Histoplasma capsulatum G186AR]KAG5304124.1 maltose permease [Histoplasma capsulatum]QSS69722.1 maltose permease [Histoplasma capsulatum G186AR]